MRTCDNIILEKPEKARPTGEANCLLGAESRFEPGGFRHSLHAAHTYPGRGALGAPEGDRLGAGGARSRVGTSVCVQWKTYRSPGRIDGRLRGRRGLPISRRPFRSAPGRFGRAQVDQLVVELAREQLAS